jgi:hypothetical protein
VTEPALETDCTFYTVANARHFIGVVALLNSLRLAGHREPLVLVDAGLTDEQRALLDDEVDLLPAPGGVAPVHLAPYGPLLRPAPVQVILDADILVIRSLEELVAVGRRGSLVGFMNNHDRFFPEWERALGLGPMRRRPYLNAGQFVLPGVMNDRLLEPWIEGQERIGLSGTRYGRARLSDAFYFADQDVVNAVLAAQLSDSEIDVREHRFAPHPPFPGLRLLDPLYLECRYSDGVSPFFLHHTMGKPWLQATRRNIYSTLLPRLLLASDVAVRLDPASLPVRIRTGLLATADRRRADLQALIVAETRRRLGTFGIRTRLAAFRSRRSPSPIGH